MTNFNSLADDTAPAEVTPAIRIRATARDPLDGLRGHAYIAARGLNQAIQRVQTSAHIEA